ncbi:acetoacetate decarboxylase family protein [Micromonospora sp. NPDC023633]|uniref:acetoacetate decarboxylase family protein n=1 Tax=Micromonospora sp. NPDC023633 TaxID=3154320 RepID=UPI0033F24522
MYDPNQFFDFLGYGRGDQLYTCPDLRTLSVYCRGDQEQLARLFAPTPFTLTDDRFLVTIADFTNCSAGPYFDAGIVFPVRYGDHEGANYFFEWEDQSWSVALGRELWGYPKKFADISLTADDAGIRGAVSLRNEPIIDLAIRYDADADGAAWDGFRTFPHLQVRAVPQPNGPAFQSFDILSRDTSPNFLVKERRYGIGELSLGQSVALGDNKLEVSAVLGAEYVIGDYAITKQNGIPDVIASLV